MQTFSGLHWAISLDVPEIVQLLIDLGADTTQRGCLLDDNRTWVCGTPLRLAQEINASKEIITILECYGREKRSESSGRCNTTTIHIGKPNWAGFLEQAKGYNEDADEKLYSALSLLRTIDALTSDPDYLTEQQVKHFPKLNNEQVGRMISLHFLYSSISLDRGWTTQNYWKFT